MDRNFIVKKHVKIETISHSVYDGVIPYQDNIGIMFYPDISDMNVCFIIWNNIIRIQFI